LFFINSSTGGLHEMTDNTLPPELERRISELEKPENQGSGFTGMDWLLLALTGIIGPVILLIWGWN
jgi:hypothetical protein